MRKKLDTRFPASRIKKIMQADEDVGKIALAVPVLVSKALELFLQDLCDRTYEITLQRGVKTMSSLHLKQCVHNCQVFDFLKDIVSKVPELGGSDAGGDDRSLKRRKTADEGNDSDEDFKRSKTQEMMSRQSSTSSCTRGRGRGRGRGRPRGSGRGGDRARYDRFEDDPETSPQHNNDNQPHDLKFSEEGFDAREQKETLVGTSSTDGGAVHNFDLNLELDENGDTSATASTATAFATTSTATAFATTSTATASAMASATATASVTTSTATASAMASATATDHLEMKHEEYAGWPLSDMDKMAIDPLKLSLLSNRIEEEEEDYDNEEG